MSGILPGRTVLKLFILQLFVTISVAIEPHCSRFHYEEKLLEKVIRAEIKMEELERKLQTTIETGASIGQDITDLKALNNKGQVAFFAKAMQHQLSMPKQRIVVFDTVITNMGNAYDHTCGKFVAPKSGTYIFFATVLGHNNAMIFLYIAVNDTDIVNLFAHGTSGGHDSTSVTVTLQLNSGDAVTVVNNHDSGMIHGNGYSSFGGFLLY